MDAIVIGAGPGGCATAWHLRQLGWQVLLLERRTYPADKLCGEFLSYDGVACLERMGLVDCLAMAGGQWVPEVLVSGVNGARWQAALPAPGLGISRRILDAAMAQACAASEVEVVYGVQVREVVGDGTGGFIVGGRQGERFTGRLVIAACGRQGGLFAAEAVEESAAKLMALKVQAPYSDRQPLIELHSFPGGYAGLCAIEAGKATLGLLISAADYRAAGGDAARFAATIMGKNLLLAERLHDLNPPWQEALAVAALRFGPGQTACDGVLLVGDAAGSINPLCGDGMSMALRGGELLAPLADRYLRGEISSDELAATWTQAWQREFNRRIRVGQWLEWALLRPQWTQLALKSFTIWPRLGQAALWWSRGHMEEINK